ncbi:MAG: hypothetical protein ACYTGQ_11925 [Planctomycetota bacterium]|jgi:hypothetical protein
MQKTENGMIVIACDFTGVEWDEVIPMIEGHRGSVLSLDALKMAIDGAFVATPELLDELGISGGGVECTMCKRLVVEGRKMWRHPNPPENANPAAALCWDCIQQADRAFAKDPDTDWQRCIEPDDRWG